MEGMQGFGAPPLRGASTAAAPSSSASSASARRELCVVEGEGMLRMRCYTEGSREALAPRGRGRRA